MPSPRSSRKAERVVRKRLADGTVKEYRYPAVRKTARYEADSVAALIAAWKLSPEWGTLADASRKVYGVYLREVELLAASAVTDVRRRDILGIRDAIASTRGHGAANAFVRASSALFGWGVDREWIEHNPVTRIRPLAGGHLAAWSEQHVALALAGLPEPFRRVVVLGMHTAQRKGDLCRMTWADYDGARIRVRQQKTGEQLAIPCHPDLRAELDAWRAEASTLTILDRDGYPWQPERLSHAMSRELAKIEGFPPHLNVHGLRKLGAARLADAGCSTHEIAAITGHRTLSMVALYTRSADQERLANAAILRLSDARTTTPKMAPKSLK